MKKSFTSEIFLVQCKTSRSISLQNFCGNYSNNIRKLTASSDFF